MCDPDERLFELPAALEEPPIDRADRHAQQFGQFGVAIALQLKSDHDLAVNHRKVLHGRHDGVVDFTGGMRLLGRRGTTTPEPRS